MANGTIFFYIAFGELLLNIEFFFGTYEKLEKSVIQI